MLETATQLLSVLEQITPLLLNISEAESAVRPAPGKWSKKEIIGHLIDSACNNQQKFTRALIAQEPIEVVGYQQDHWVRVQHYQTFDWSQLVRLWDSYNRFLAHIIANADPAKLSNTLTIDGKGPFRLDFVMPDYVEHLKHHLQAVLPGEAHRIPSRFLNVYGNVV